MSVSNARFNYVKTMSMTETAQEQNSRAIMIALEQLERALNDLVSSKNPEDREAPFEIALSRIYLLQKCLNFNEFPELAKNLFRVYEFSRKAVINYCTNNHNSASLQSAADCIGMIRESWSEAIVQA
jgi:flagellin-specific chaperone FliS